LADFIGTTSKRSWDYVILDEGQFIKNCTTKVHKSCSRLASYPQTRRLLLTGTPIQNNLNKELWALFDWVTRGKLLGKQRTFSKQYAIPIQRGRNKDATESNLLTAEQKNKQLQTALEPHLLQRLKEIEIKDILPWKKELVVWTHLSASQRHLYEKYLVDSGQVTAVLSGEKNSPVEAITWLKKLCAHPCLVDEQMAESCTDSLQFLKHSAKLQVLVDLVHRLNKSGHRFIIFSQSTKMLDIIEQVVPLSLARIDGQTKKNRQAIVDCFNIANSPFDGMLVSTRAGGVGLTLTGADRAIIYDPSWNPSDDMQATDRIYRIGQEHNVTIYRFIAAGTVEGE
jgi:SNF2 family DNA or RNA helicase